MAKTQSPVSRRRGRTLDPAGPTTVSGQNGPGAGSDEPETPVLPTPEQDLPERRFERIAIRAREIYEARGGEHGQALDDWLQAESEIDSELEEPLALDDEE
jgi:hypothetical protein